MNDATRKRLRALKDQLETIKGALEEMATDERDKFENMPESLQGGDRGQKLEAAADSLDEAVEGFDALVDAIDEAVE